MLILPSPTFDAPLPDGVYVNLGEPAYFGQEALGSTDVVALAQKKFGWWWASAYNPRRKPRSTKDLLFGSALHCLLLEGRPAYKARYARLPEKRDFPGLINTREEMHDALAGDGFTVPAAGGKNSDWWRQAMRENMPHVPVWDTIVKDFGEEAGQRTLVPGDDADSVDLMVEMALDPHRQDNKELRKLWAEAEGWPVLAEVSVFWHEDGVRRRARLDRMFPKFDVDVKTLGNVSGRPLRYETGDLIPRRGHDIQRSDHFDARLAAYAMIQAHGADAIHGGSPEQRKALIRMAEEEPDFDYVWLYYQKPDPSLGRAPVIFPVMDVSWIPQASGAPIWSEILEEGHSKKARALATYREGVARFGLNTAWGSVEPLHYTDTALTPHVVLPPWFKDSESTTPDAYEKETSDDA